MKKTLLCSAVAMIVAGSLAIMGCMTIPVALTGQTTYIAPDDLVTEIGPASGSSFGGIVFGLPMGEGQQMGKALERALSSSGGDALVECKVDYKTYNLFFAYLTRTAVYGKAVKVKKGGRAR